MAQQKLYTEEDVLKMLRSFHTLEMNVQLSMYKLTPIELPSDEEIESGMNQRLFLSDKHAHFNSGAKAGFKLGAEWMKEQILNQNK